jgi:tetratricopeptide (TPR) repeat protein
MRPTIPILLLLFLLLIVPAVPAEDVQEWYIKGQNAVTVGDYSAAVTYYNNAIQMDKNHASSYAGRATALNMLGKYNDAIASADSALAIKPMDAVASMRMQQPHTTISSSWSRTAKRPTVTRHTRT